MLSWCAVWRDKTADIKTRYGFKKLFQAIRRQGNVCNYKRVVPVRNPSPLAIEIGLNIPAQYVIIVLERIVVSRGYPLELRMNNGPEFSSLTLAQWAGEERAG